MASRSLKFRKPMGAKEFEPNRHRVEFPCYVQPKLDGVLCVTDGQNFWSKNGKRFPISNTAHLQVPRFPQLVNGELMLDDDGADFEDIISTLKRAGHPQSHHLRFNAFDIVTDEPYVQRKLALKYLFEYRQLRSVHVGWRRVSTFKIASDRELEKAHKQFLEQGYEGTMVRTAMGLYVSKKTRDLLKWKPLKDREFEIIDVREAKGKDKGTPIFICACGGTEPDATFRVRPMGTDAQRRKMWRQRHRLIGKLLTVEYQNLTKYGVPRFPRAKVLRDYE